MVKANKIQLDYIEEVIKKADNPKHPIFHCPDDDIFKFYPICFSDPKLFYRKPVIICAPHLYLPGQQMICKCKKKMQLRGWQDARYVHGLKGGMYLKQRKYQCNHCKVGTINAFQALQFECITEDIRLLYPLYERHNSMLHEELMNYIVSDAMTSKTFSEIGNGIGSFRTQEYLRRRTLYCVLQKKFDKQTVRNRHVESFSSFDDAEGYNELMQPTDSYLTSVYNGNFILNVVVVV